MEILNVTSRYRPHVGGVESHVAELAERFADSGHDVTVFSADAGTRVDNSDLPTVEERNGVRIRRFRSAAPGGAFHVAPGIAPAVRRSSADVIHAHNLHSLPLFFAALGRDSTPLVVTPHYHGASASYIRDTFLSAYRPLGGWVLRRADAIVAVSKWEQRKLDVDFGVHATVVPNGLDVARFRESNPAARDEPYILCVGRLKKYKGVQHVIRALPEIDDPAYDLLVAGSGPYGPTLKRVGQETGVADRVEFLGYVPDADLPELYAGAAAFVTVSGFEAYGMTVAEALAAGTPCVVRRVRALNDWAGRDDCVCVHRVVSSAIAGAVDAATSLSAPSEPLPTWDDVVTDVGQLYQQVLERY